jgi:uncharacterized protein
MFDFSDYHVRELDINQGYKPLDFGMGGLTGSVNKDGRIIAVNNYHPEHGYVTLTSIPPFPDADRYDQSKVRAYRKSLVTNEGFGLQFEQQIIKREYYLVEDAVPFMRFTFADGTIAECVTIAENGDMMQVWKFSAGEVAAKVTGQIWLQRAAYTQLTEGGILPMPPVKTTVSPRRIAHNRLHVRNEAIDANGIITSHSLVEQNNGLVFADASIEVVDKTFIFSVSVGDFHAGHGNKESWLHMVLQNVKKLNMAQKHLILNRARVYGYLCTIPIQDWASACIITDHMILPLSWNRDSYYVASMFLQSEKEHYRFSFLHLEWLFRSAWKGTYSRVNRKPITGAWGRSYMVNGMPKDNRAYQLDQQIFPLLEACEFLRKVIHDNNFEDFRDYCEILRHNFIDALQGIAAVSIHPQIGRNIFSTDETPADDEIPLHYHFSSHVLLWHTLRQIEDVFEDDEKIIESAKWMFNIRELKAMIEKYFITEHNGKRLYAYATDGQGHYHLYHDANDIPLVMMPLWGFCSKDDPVWRNTIAFAFSDDNPGFFDGVLGSVHTSAPWSLGDAQELILCKVISDSERYQRVWERIEKAVQWDGALPEAYDAKDFSVVSRHWFAWPNAMVAIADNISWDWEAEQGK